MHCQMTGLRLNGETSPHRAVKFFIVKHFESRKLGDRFRLFFFASLTGILEPLHVVKFKVFSHKEKHFKFELETVLKAVVSSLHALFQKDLQQVIKSKYSFVSILL